MKRKEVETYSMLRQWGIRWVTESLLTAMKWKHSACLDIGEFVEWRNLEQGQSKNSQYSLGTITLWGYSTKQKDHKKNKKQSKCAGNDQIVLHQAEGPHDERRTDMIHWGLSNCEISAPRTRTAERKESFCMHCKRLDTAMCMHWKRLETAIFMHCKRLVHRTQKENQSMKGRQSTCTELPILPRDVIFENDLAKTITPWKEADREDVGPRNRIT